MKILWLVVLVLGVVYLAVWGATKTDDLPSVRRPVVTKPSTPQETAEGIAKGDAISRVPSNASIEVLSATPKLFVGNDLRLVPSGTSGAKAGYVIVLVATVDKKQTSTLTYHAVPPDQVVFVEQKVQ